MRPSAEHAITAAGGRSTEALQSAGSTDIIERPVLAW